MRLVIFLSVFMLLVSCRSHKDTQSESLNSATIVSQSQSSKDSASTVLDILKYASEIELSGITVDFSQPDTILPDSRAAPKSIHIDKARVKEYSNAATLNTIEVIGNESVDNKTDTISELKQETTSDYNFLSPPGYVLALSILSAFALIGIFIYLKFFKKS